jgi:hypothetical protein
MLFVVWSLVILRVFSAPQSHSHQGLYVHETTNGIHKELSEIYMILSPKSRFGLSHAFKALDHCFHVCPINEQIRLQQSLKSTWIFSFKSSSLRSTLEA